MQSEQCSDNKCWRGFEGLGDGVRGFTAGCAHIHIHTHIILSHEFSVVLTAEKIPSFASCKLLDFFPPDIFDQWWVESKDVAAEDTQGSWRGILSCLCIVCLSCWLGGATGRGHVVVCSKLTPL